MQTYMQVSKVTSRSQEKILEWMCSTSGGLRWTKWPFRRTFDVTSQLGDSLTIPSLVLQAHGNVLSTPRRHRRRCQKLRDAVSEATEHCPQHKATFISVRSFVNLMSIAL